MGLSLSDLLKRMLEMSGSDLHITTNSPPQVRVHGHLVPLDLPQLTPAETKQLAYSVMTDSQKHRFEESLELDFSFGLKGLARFRANVFNQRGATACVLRLIPFEIKSFNQLGLPTVVSKLCDKPRGLILVTGPTGSGKSTTLAAMVDKINRDRREHILTIEDPIEFLYTHKRATIHQRELHSDAPSFPLALSAAMHQAPKVILISELRDHEIVEMALEAAETGHLVLSTLHTLNATETVNRVISTFPPHQEDQIRDQLAAVMQGIICQRLVVRADGKGRVPAVEVMVATGLLRDCIRESSKTPDIPAIIAAGHAQYAMQTFDQSLLQLHREELITYETARDAATNPDDFDLKVKGILSTGEMTWQASPPPQASPQPAAQARAKTTSPFRKG